ncbi:unnamed protein product [Caenorhabditis auriculariae]|uniref:Uncharacterized protein n=1 Tax=Caenorhabditis auriculariae TaxID=2777116 RepID=A0A8S1HGD0_9PELO|nr:unnamed protein product [Caenorhabditis auriculariae]
MVEPNDGDDEDSPCPPRVRDLAKRFEAAPSVATRTCKRGGVTRKDNGKSQIGGNGPPRVFQSAGQRKKSSLRRRTQSTGDVKRRPEPGESSIRKSVSSNFSDKNDAPGLEAKPVPTLRRKAMTSETRKDPRPTYQERVRVSLTTTATKRPQVSPPPPPAVPANPPSAERLRRIPSYLKPTPLPRSSATLPMSFATLRRPQIKSPPPPVSKKPEITKQLPRVPNIPVPKPPRNDLDVVEDCYEEILMTNDTEPTPSLSPSSSRDDSFSSHYFGSGSYCSRTASCSCRRCKRRSQHDVREEEEVFDEAEPELPAVKPRFLSATLQRAAKPSQRRPVSSLEFEKLFRFKSEFQLNLSKKMVQLRQKVGDKQQKTFSKCHLSANLLETDFLRDRKGFSRTPDDDRCIYGDDWSSEDDQDERRSSMYKQLEEQLNQAFPAYASSQMSENESGEFGNDENDDVFQRARPAIGSLPVDEEFSSSLDEPSPDDEQYTRQYTSRLLPVDQPLYQHYMMEEQDKLLNNVLPAEERELSEDLTPPPTAPEVKIQNRRESSLSSDSGRGADCSTSTSALTSNTSMRRDRLVGSSNFGSQRSLWCELPEVKAAGLLESLDDESKIQQEAYFEVITSEASYLRSLNILITHFMACPQMLGNKSALSVISNADRKQLFSNIFAVRDCSERLLCDLETRLEENLVLDDICDILNQHFEKNFEVYVKYCSNQVYQDRTLRRLKTESPGFLSAVQKLEEHRQCQGLDMRSFLMLPMQRITRYPLLLYAIIDRLQPNCERYSTAAQALTASNKVVRECNEGARRMERTEQLLEIDRRLVYKDADLKRIPLVSNSRHLVKRGVLTQLVERRTTGILQSRQKARTLHVFLFSDILMITKKKLNGTYVCKDYSARRFVDVEPIEPDNPKIPSGAISSLVGRPHLFLCVLMRNARGRQSELLLSADSETDRERWLSAVRPPTSSNPEEKVYAEWDCPQVVALHVYTPSQQDELQLQVGDTINVLRKMPDGWLYGERVADGLGGWFPSSYVQSIVNDHTRANNYRQRLRIIQAAAGWRGNVPSSAAGRSGNPLMDRLRRMSNPKSFFTTGTVGL